MLFLGLTFAVLFGTLLPMLVAATSGATISVGAPWFNGVGVPIMVALLFLMGIGPALPWGPASWSTLRERFTWPLLVAVAVGVVALVAGLRDGGSLGTLGLAVFIGGVMVDEVVRGARARAAGRDEDPPTAAWRLAPATAAATAATPSISACWSWRSPSPSRQGCRPTCTVTLAPGESAQIGGYEVTHERLVVEPLANDARVIETRAEVRYAGPQEGALGTALRDYPNSPTAIATPAVRTSLAEDLYVTLLAADPADRCGQPAPVRQPARGLDLAWRGDRRPGRRLRHLAGPEAAAVVAEAAVPRRAIGQPGGARLMRRLRWLLVPILVLPLGWLLFTGFGRDPREIASPLIGQPGARLDASPRSTARRSPHRRPGRAAVRRSTSGRAGACRPASTSTRCWPLLTSLTATSCRSSACSTRTPEADAEAFLARYGDAGYAAPCRWRRQPGDRLRRHRPAGDASSSTPTASSRTSSSAR